MLVKVLVPTMNAMRTWLPTLTAPGVRDFLAQCLDLLTPQGHVVVNVANIDSGAHFTPLAWDVGKLLGALRCRQLC